MGVINRGDLVEFLITDMTEDGQGIGHLLMDDGDNQGSGIAIFVEGGVLGDEVQAEITKTKKKYAFAVARDIKKYSPHRSKDVCPHISECGGCAYGMLDYPAQLRMKEKHIRDKLERVTGLKDPNVKPIISMESIGGRLPAYRNKAVMAVGLDNKGTPVIGFRARKSHKVIDCKECRIQAPPAMIVAGVVRRFFCSGTDAKLREWFKVQLDTITVRTAFSTGEVMVVFRVKDIKQTERIKMEISDLIYELDDAITSPYSFESFAVTDGRKSEVLAGKKTIMDEISGLKFEISPESFYQVNALLTEKLYDTALMYALNGSSEAEKRKLNLLDVYCGVGTMGLIAAGRTDGNFLGIEVVKQAVIDANRNAVINGIVNARFIVGAAETILPDLATRNGEKSVAQGDPTWEQIVVNGADVVILDPPRKGCEKVLLESVSFVSPDRIVYVSCDPATLARDIKVLMEHGYCLKEATPCDMFASSSHTEVVAWMERP